MTTAATHIKKLLNLKFFDGYLGLIEPIEKLIKERDQFRTSLSELSHKNEQDVCELDAYRAGNHPDLKPQLSEIRYVLHGDIRPCTVLYSDDTTTLLRLDEGDVMCETDTIEWSDSVTYRCQELLKGCAAPLRVIRHMAQLVRDERILLNDDALEASGDEGTHTVCVQCERVFDVSLDLCPLCHTRKGPLSLDDDEVRPTPLAPWEAPSYPEDKWRCTNCLHDFPSACDRCPKCYTPKER